MDITSLFYIDATGYHFADYPTVLAWLTTQYQNIYGADIYLGADSEDGQMVAIQAKAIYDTGTLGASIYNSFSPVTAQGLGLSRLVKINGLSRQVPSNSTADLTIVGQSGTILTNAIATDSLNQQWLIPTTTIPGGGSIVATAVAAVPGAIAAVANSITTIFTPTRGWQSVNNAAAATPGAPVESDSALRIRQTQSTADPSLTVVEGTTGAIANLPGVTKVRTYENDTESTDGNGIPAHAISSCVLGGDATSIANEIALHKTPGAVTFGNTSENVYDTHGMPLTINFNRPTGADIQVEITISTNQGWSSDYIALIQASVAAAINPIPIGDPILITQLYAPAYLIGTPPGLTYNISLLRIGLNGGSLGTSDIDLTYNQDPACDPNTDVTVIVT